MVASASPRRVDADASTATPFTFVIGARNPSLIVVPPGVYHGWMSLEDDTQMISTASEVYNRQNPDEVRVAPDSFGYVWEVKGR